MTGKGLSVKIRADATQFDRTMRGVRGGISRVAGPIKQLGKIAAVAGAAIVGMGVAAGVLAKKLIDIGEGANTATARTANVVRQMGLFGDKAKEVSDRLDEVAQATALQTGTDKQSIQMTQAKLATFGELLKTADKMGGAFDRVTDVAVNLAATGFGTAESNAVMLGKAFGDVEFGLTSLARTGALTRTQINAISDEFKDSGDQAKAFEGILQALERQTKNAAKETANGTARIGVAWTLLREEIGKPMAEEFGKLADNIAAATPKILEAVRAMAPKIGEAARGVFSAISEALQGDIGKLMALGEFLGSAFGRAFIVGAQSALRGIGAKMFQGGEAVTNKILSAPGFGGGRFQTDVTGRAGEDMALVSKYRARILAKELAGEFDLLIQRLNYDPNRRVEAGGSTFREAAPGETSQFRDAQGRALIEIRDAIREVSRNTKPSLFPAQ
jgi:hypothetical protein